MNQLPKIISLPEDAWYDPADQPPLVVRLTLFKSVLATVLALILLPLAEAINRLVCLAGQPLALITLALPTIRIYVAAIIIELAQALATIIAPGYVGAGGMSL